MSGEKPTEFAMAALGLAELFQINFGNERLVVGTKPRVGGALQSQEATYRMEISAPEGTSTGGGKQAVQPIKLIPQQGTTIVIGTVNQVEKTTELRTFEYLAHVHAQRFKGAAIPLQREKYNDVLKRMQAFFAGAGLRLVMTDAPPVPAEAPRAGSSTTLVIAGMLVAAVAIGLALLTLVRQKTG